LIIRRKKIDFFSRKRMQKSCHQKIVERERRVPYLVFTIVRGGERAGVAFAVAPVPRTLIGEITHTLIMNTVTPFFIFIVIEFFVFILFIIEFFTNFIFIIVRGRVRLRGTFVAFGVPLTIIFGKTTPMLIQNGVTPFIFNRPPSFPGVRVFGDMSFPIIEFFVFVLFIIVTNFIFTIVRGEGSFSGST